MSSQKQKPALLFLSLITVTALAIGSASAQEALDEYVDESGNIFRIFQLSAEKMEDKVRIQKGGEPLSIEESFEAERVEFLTEEDSGFTKVGLAHTPGGAWVTGSTWGRHRTPHVWHPWPAGTWVWPSTVWPVTPVWGVGTAANTCSVSTPCIGGIGQASCFGVGLGGCMTLQPGHSVACLQTNPMFGSVTWVSYSCITQQPIVCHPIHSGLPTASDCR